MIICLLLNNYPVHQMTTILLCLLLADNMVSAADIDDIEDDEERDTMDFEYEKCHSAMDNRNTQDLGMYQEFLTEQLEYRVSLLLFIEA